MKREIGNIKSYFLEKCGVFEGGFEAIFSLKKNDERLVNRIKKYIGRILYIKKDNKPTTSCPTVSGGILSETTETMRSRFDTKLRHKVAKIRANRP